MFEGAPGHVVRLDGDVVDGGNRREAVEHDSTREVELLGVHDRPLQRSRGEVE